MNGARRVALIIGHELRMLRRDPLPLMVMVAFPIITTAFLTPAFRPVLVERGYADATGAEHVVPGQAVMAAFFLVSFVAFGFFSEHTWATWDRLRASPTSSAEIVLGKVLPAAGMGVAQLLVLLVAGVLVFDLEIRGDALGLAPLVVSFSAALVALGVAIAAVCRTAQQANAFAYLGLVVLGAIGGAFVPFEVLPAWARSVAPATPTYWAMRGMRAVILDGGGISATLLPCLVLAAMAGVFATVAVRRLRFDDAKAGWV